MSDLHTIIGAGPLGTAVATKLIERGLRVRVVSRSGRSSATGAEAIAADATDAASITGAIRGSSVVYQCAQPAYNRWVAEFPSFQRGIIEATAAANADIVIADNLYSYGDPRGATISEASPEAATTRKGAVRRSMARAALAAHDEGRLRVALSRPSHYFGPGYDQSGSMVFARALAGKPLQFLGRPDQPHSFSYVPDAGAVMATIGTSETGWGRVWIPPVQAALTQQELAQRIWMAAGQVGAVKTQFIGRRALRLLGIFSPLLREVVEMSYEFERPYVVNSSAFETAFDASPTPLDEAIATTLDWYRPR